MLKNLFLFNITSLFGNPSTPKMVIHLEKHNLTLLQCFMHFITLFELKKIFTFAVLGHSH